jgi:predicted anti-sigma-YlaC factor YlaD
MKCQELLEALNDYVDGETQSALCRAIQEHLADCNPCRIVIDNIRQTITLYRVEEAVLLPAGLHERVCSIMQRGWAAESPLKAMLDL